MCMQEMIDAAVNRLLRTFMFIISIFVIPIVRMRALGNRPRCPPIRNRILLYSATELSQKIRRKEISSEDVVSAYVARCKEVNPVLNAIVEERFGLALQEARKVDVFLTCCTKTENELARDTPLLGLPVTVKQSIGMEGMSHSVGMKEEKPTRANHDANVVARVRKAGGIPLLVSNTPEMCMWWETYNNVTGTTWNPYDTSRTCGGSSGGEAALLGSGSSILSLSSDIAGSARLPAMFCGIFGHKPTPGIVSSVGHRPDCSDKNWSNFFTIGPMVRYAEDIPLLLKVMCQQEDIVHRLNEKVSLRNVRFFYMEDDSGSGATNAIDREMKSAVQKVVRHVESLHGIKVQKSNLDMKASFEIAASILLSIQGADCIFSKQDDPQEWRSVFMEVLRYVSFMSPHTFPNVAYGILKKISDKLPRAHHSRMMQKSAALKKQFQDVLGDNGVLIYPSFITAAHYPFEIMYKVCNVSYMMIFNALGLPVTQCPVGLNRHGLPIGVQVVANPGCDHLTIAVAQEIQRAFGGWQSSFGNEKTI